MKKEKISPSAVLRDKLNNTEYTDFMTRFETLVLAITLGILKVPEEIFKAFQANLVTMRDLVNRTMASIHTSSLLNLDNRRDSITVFIFATIRSMLKSPIDDQRIAAEALNLITKPYVGMQNLPNRQQTTQTEGLLLDLAKDPYGKHISTLGLDMMVKELNAINTEYRSLTDQRTQENTANALEAARSIRRTMNEEYTEMTDYIQGATLFYPSPGLTEFISNLNTVINETKASYKQRTAQSKTQVDVEEAEDTEDVETPETDTKND